MKIKTGQSLQIIPSQGWPKKRNSYFRHFGCISSGFCYNAALKAYNFGKNFKLWPKDQFDLATLSKIVSQFMVEISDFSEG
jgi:hypothetical protein